MRIEHWDVAFNHGKTAALNMLGRESPHTVVPTSIPCSATGANSSTWGPRAAWDEEIVRGSIADGRFTNWYLQEGLRRRRAHRRALG